MSEGRSLNKAGIRYALAALAVLSGLHEMRSAEALEWEPVEGAQQTISEPEPVKQDTRPGTALNWTSVESSDATTQEQQGLNWTAVSETDQTDAEPINRAIVWEPIEPGEVITIDDIDPSQDFSLEPSNDLEKPVAYSRGSMIQIGKTVYSYMGFHALQRQPNTWVSIGISAIDDSWQSRPSPCERGNFFDQCSDGLMENLIRLYNSEDWFSLDLQWVIHSLSGEGSPFNFRVGGTTFGDNDEGTKFMEGQSLGFRMARSFWKDWGISIGGNRLYHLDDTTDLPRNLYIKGTRIFRLNNSPEPPIAQVTLGLMSDVYNPDSMLGSFKYPSWLQGGLYPSTFAERFGEKRTKQRGYEKVAGVSSAFVCAEETIFRDNPRPPETANPDCIQKVAFGPVASIGIAPWPWLSLYATYKRTLNLGVSLKPFKTVPWTFSIEAISPIPGFNEQYDRMVRNVRCPDGDGPFKQCRTRVGLWTEFSF